MDSSDMQIYIWYHMTGYTCSISWFLVPLPRCPAPPESALGNAWWGLAAAPPPSRGSSVVPKVRDHPWIQTSLAQSRYAATWERLGVEHRLCFPTTENVPSASLLVKPPEPASHRWAKPQWLDCTAGPSAGGELWCRCPEKMCGAASKPQKNKRNQRTRMQTT